MNKKHQKHVFKNLYKNMKTWIKKTYVFNCEATTTRAISQLVHNRRVTVCVRINENTDIL